MPLDKSVTRSQYMCYVCFNEYIEVVIIEESKGCYLRFNPCRPPRITFSSYQSLLTLL